MGWNDATGKISKSPFCDFLWLNLVRESSSFLNRMSKNVFDALCHICRMYSYWLLLFEFYQKLLNKTWKDLRKISVGTFIKFWKYVRCRNSPSIKTFRGKSSLVALWVCTDSIMNFSKGPFIYFVVLWVFRKSPVKAALLFDRRCKLVIGLSESWGFLTFSR